MLGLLFFLCDLPVHSVTHLGSNFVQLKADKLVNMLWVVFIPSICKGQKRFYWSLCQRNSWCVWRPLWAECCGFIERAMHELLCSGQEAKREIWEALWRRWHFELSLKEQAQWKKWRKKQLRFMSWKQNSKGEKHYTVDQWIRGIAAGIWDSSKVRGREGCNKGWNSYSRSKLDLWENSLLGKLVFVVLLGYLQ